MDGWIVVWGMGVYAVVHWFDEVHETVVQNALLLRLYPTCIAKYSSASLESVNHSSVQWGERDIAYGFTIPVPRNEKRLSGLSHVGSSVRNIRKETTNCNSTLSYSSIQDR